MNNSLIVTLTGPSCSGKTTLESMLKERGFASVISTTTRPQRAGEVHGESYYFTNREGFLTSQAAGFYVESVEFNNNLYAVSKQEFERVIKAGKPVVLIVEPNGLIQIQKYLMDIDVSYFSFFIDCPAEVILERFLKRYAHELFEPLNSRKDVEKITKTYASRLGVMTGPEREWLDGQISQYGSIYDRTIDLFDEASAPAVIEHIVAMAAGKQTA